jgi:hypothetical protein
MRRCCACLSICVLSRRMRLRTVCARCSLSPRSHHRAPLLPCRSPLTLLRRGRLRRHAYQAASKRNQ